MSTGRLSRRVLTAMIGADAAQPTRHQPPAIAGHSLVRRVLAGLLGVRLRQRSSAEPARSDHTEQQTVPSRPAALPVSLDDPAAKLTQTILVPAIIGILAYGLTGLLGGSWTVQLSAAVALGAVALTGKSLVQFRNRLAAMDKTHLTHIAERRLQGISRFDSVNETGLRVDTINQLAGQVARLSPNSPPLVEAFVQAELQKTLRLVRELGEQGQMTNEDEDLDWLLSLTRSVQRSLDAVNAAGKTFDEGFWNSDLGRRYLDRQREAIARGVKIRRIFIVDRPEIEQDLIFQRMCRTQAEIGIDIRVLQPSPTANPFVVELDDFALFDDALSYEVISDAQVNARSMNFHTRLQLHPDEVKRRIIRYQGLWTAARVMRGA